MKLLTVILLGILALCGLVGCGDDGYNDVQDESQIRDCVEAGGEPYYATDKWGNAHYITCQIDRP